MILIVGADFSKLSIEKYELSWNNEHSYFSKKEQAGLAGLLKMYPAAKGLPATNDIIITATRHVEAIILLQNLKR